MPFIQTQVSIPVTKEQEEKLKEKLGQTITVLGKSETWLMIGLEDNCRLFFQGEKTEKIAFVEIKLYGKANRQSYEEMTKRVSDIFEEVLEIPKDKLYVTYQEYSHWGFNGSNF